MTTLMVSQILRSALLDDRGISSLEYALLAVGILTGLAAALAAVAGVLDPLYSTTVVGLL